MVPDYAPARPVVQLSAINSSAGCGSSICPGSLVALVALPSRSFGRFASMPRGRNCFGRPMHCFIGPNVLFWS